MKNIKINSQKLNVGKIVCVGRNYAEHAKELGNEIPEFPLIFLKPASNLIFSGEKIVHPDYSNEMHHEVELVLLIGKKIKNADESAALNAIAGYAVGLDMTLRDIQSELKKKGHPWTLAKCFDGSAVVSDFVSSENYNLKGNEKITLSVNDETKQNSTLEKMIFPPVEIVKYISEKMTLEPGDLIFTGTPKGVSKVTRGDKIFAEIENIGRLETEII
jgi:5-carboxymethyl-2-hydroxymuconate isomerase